MAKNVFIDEIRSIFNNRTDAGQRLASELTGYKGSQTVVLAIPRGGVPVAVEVAVKLEASLDMIFVRKIPIPDEPEAGYGAVAEDGATILNRPMVRDLRLTASEIEEQAENVRAEIKRRNRAFREKLLPVSLVGKTVIIIDDGLASGYTMLAAVKSARQQQAAEVVVAVPAASMDGYELVKPGVSELVALVIARTSWFAVASFYSQWHDLTDAEVFNHLEDFKKRIETLPSQ